MTGRARVLMLTAVVLMLSGTIMLSIARGSGEPPENPYWKVAGKRLESGTKGVTVEGASGVEMVLKGTIASKEVEVKCETSGMKSAYIEGSAAKHDGKVSGVLEMSKCKLWVNESGFKEKSGCEVEPITSVTLTGSLWLEGSKASEGANTVVVFKPAALTEGKEEIAKIKIKNKTECTTFEGTHVLEGKFAAKVVPQNEEFTRLRWTLPSTPITPVWRPASEEGEETLGVTFGSAGILEGAVQAESSAKETYGGGTSPIAGEEAPYWNVGGERLGAGVEKEVESGPLDPEPATFRSKLDGKEIEIRCTKLVLREAKLIGTNPQLDGKLVVRGIEFAECKLFVNEGWFKEKASCEVPAFETKKLSGRFWFEGTKAERKTKGLLVFEPESGEVFAEPAIKNKGSETCPVAEAAYVIKGDLPLQITHENAEVEENDFSRSEFTFVTAWQSAEQEGERRIELVHLCYTVVVKIPEFPVKLKGGGKFGFTT